MTTLAPPWWFRVAMLLAAGIFPVRTAAAQPEGPPLSRPSPDPPAVANEPASPRLTIASDSSCPSGPAVAEALATLCPPAQWPNGTVRIHAMDGALAVELVADGSTQRQLRVADDCGMRATTVALVIATWTGELASEAAGAPVLRGQAPRSEAAAPPPPPPTVVAPPSPAAVRERELAAGLLLAMLGGFAPGLRVDFAQTRVPRGLGWQVGLVLPARRESTAGVATASWTRVAANLTVNGRTTRQGLAVSAEAGLAVAYAATSGHGFAITQGAQALTAGVVVGARLALPWRRLRIWTDVRAYRWLLPQTIAVDSALGERVAVVALPSSDLQWAVGLAYPFR